MNIISDFNGKKIVRIDNIYFKGRQNIKWQDVETYLKRYVGQFYKNIEAEDYIYIGKDLPDEYSGSKDTARLKGALAKAKANAVQGLPELIKIATKKRYKENLTGKHRKNAQFGWYRYNSRFTLPVYGESGKVERYNTFAVELLVRHDMDGKIYLYDVVNIKKETGTPLEL